MTVPGGGRTAAPLLPTPACDDRGAASSGADERGRPSESAYRSPRVATAAGGIAHHTAIDRA